MSNPVDEVGTFFAGLDDTVHDAVDSIGGMVQNILDNPLVLIETVALTAMLGPGGLALASQAGAYAIASAAVSAAHGGSIEQIAISAGASYVGAQIGAQIGAATEFGTIPFSEQTAQLLADSGGMASTMQSIVSSSSGAAAAAALRGKPLDQILTAGFTGGINTLVTDQLMAAGYNPKDIDTQVIARAVASASGAVLQGQDVGEAITRSTVATLAQSGMQAAADKIGSTYDQIKQNSETLQGISKDFNDTKTAAQQAWDNLTSYESTAKEQAGQASSLLAQFNQQKDEVDSLTARYQEQVGFANDPGTSPQIAGKTFVGGMAVVKAYQDVQNAARAEASNLANQINTLSAQANDTVNQFYSTKAAYEDTVTNKLNPTKASYDGHIREMLRLSDEAVAISNETDKLGVTLGTATGEYTVKQHELAVNLATEVAKTAGEDITTQLEEEKAEEQTRLAEQQKQEADALAQKQAEEAEAASLAQANQEEQTRLAEQQKQEADALAQKQAEDTRLAQEAEDTRLAQETRVAEETRVAQEAEDRRLVAENKSDRENKEAEAIYTKLLSTNPEEAKRINDLYTKQGGTLYDAVNTLDPEFKEKVIDTINKGNEEDAIRNGLKEWTDASGNKFIVVTGVGEPTDVGGLIGFGDPAVNAKLSALYGGSTGTDDFYSLFSFGSADKQKTTIDILEDVLSNPISSPQDIAQAKTVLSKINPITTAVDPTKTTTTTTTNTDPTKTTKGGLTGGNDITGGTGGTTTGGTTTGGTTTGGTTTSDTGIITTGTGGLTTTGTGTTGTSGTSTGTETGTSGTGTGTGTGTTTTTTIPKVTIPGVTTSTASPASTKSPFQAATEGGIPNLTPGLTKAMNDYQLTGLNAIDTTPEMKSGGSTSAIDDLNSGKEYDPMSTSSVGYIKPGLTRANIQYALTGMPAPKMHKADGGEIMQEDLSMPEGHHPEFFSEGGLHNRYVRGDGDGTSDDVPAMLANGEWVIPADVVSALGNGSNDAGAKVLDEFMKIIRQHKQDHEPHKLPPDSKGPLSYLKEAYKNENV